MIQDTVAVADSTSGIPPAVQSAQVDTASVLDDFGAGVSETGNLLLTGQWSRLSEIIAGSFVTKLEEMLPNLVGAVFVFLIFYAGYRVAAMLLDRFLTRSKRVDAGLHHLLTKVFRIIVWFFIIVLVLSQFGVNITALLAGLGIAGIAVGLAAKDTIENFISGITILVDRPFRIGDQVSVETTYGTIIEITLRSTRLRTRDNRIMIMPNVHMINQKLYNHSAMGLLRVEIPFGIAYKEFPDKARKALLDAIKDDPRLRSELPAAVVVTGLGNSSIDMALYLYLIHPEDEQPIRWEYVEIIRETLRDAGIEIPFPHLQLFFDEAKALQKPLQIESV